MHRHYIWLYLKQFKTHHLYFFFCSVIIKGMKYTRGTPKLIDYALATNEEKTQKMTDRQTDRQVYDITQDTT